MFKENLQKNWKMLLISSIAIFAPMIAGLILWDKLPETIATHFNFNNQPNSYSSKAFVVFGIPSILFLIHLFASFATFIDKKSANIPQKALNVIFWLVPTIGTTVMTIIFLFALQMKINVGFVCNVLLGVLFVILGNIMPKASQNSTFGIRIKPTLSNSQNCFFTHRFAGMLWAAGGIIIIATAFLNNPFIFFGVLLLITILPIIYSYRYASKHKN